MAGLFCGSDRLALSLSVYVCALLVVGFVVKFSFLVATAGLPFSFDGFVSFVAIFRIVLSVSWLQCILYSLKGDLHHSYSI